MSTYVSIGKNIGNVPMSEDDWRDFRNDLERVLWEACDHTLYFRGEGVGQWENGTQEQSFTVIAAPPKNAGELRETLAMLAVLYWQDAIALTIAEPEFITPS